jgi:hypothetical protein
MLLPISAEVRQHVDLPRRERGAEDGARIRVGEPELAELGQHVLGPRANWSAALISQPEARELRLPPASVGARTSLSAVA